MKKLFAVSSFLGGFLIVSLVHAADLKQSKFTQVINDVRIVSAANSLEKPAVVNALFNMPDLVRTGAASRAELVAADDTITRVGANTVFSFDPASRTIDLQQGSLLFHSPKGKGGGTIRTGSATASVLGTTLIVTTTRSGGFKVIDLEGHVAIKFLSGLQQDLYPGQMTFVLPGGRPAPVLTIRLDTLTKDSHLVQGFDQPLPSMPLIQQQVDTQVKEIQSGQAQDTGLLVGDDASSTSVQVVKIDPNNIPAALNNNGPAGSVTIDTPTLTPAFITSFSDSGSPVTEFFAPTATPNIFINTPSIDLSPYASPSSFFEFMAPDTLTINSSVAFTGLPTDGSSLLELEAGNQLLIAPGSTVEADVGLFSLYAPNAITLNGVNILDNGSFGEIAIGFPDLLSLINSSSSFSSLPIFSSAITINGGSIQAQSFIGLFAENNISIANSNLVASGEVLIGSVNGNVTMSNSMLNTSALDLYAGGSVTVTSDVSHSFQVGTVTVNAGDGIFVDGGNNSPAVGIGMPKPGSISMTAVNSLTAQNLKLDFTTVNLTAHTINLTNVAFSNGSTVNLASHVAMLAANPNTGAVSVSGQVNFITGVTYGGVAAQNYVPLAQGGTWSSVGAPINITAGPN
jgi:hypothetical protein